MARKPLLTIVFGLVFALLAAVLVEHLYEPKSGLGNLLWRFELGAYDVRLSTRASRFRDDIVIVAVDDESLQQLGVWPWPRGLHAQLLDRLNEAGARLIGLDMLFSDLSGSIQSVDSATGQLTLQPAVSEGDEALAGALKRHPRVVLAGQITNDLTTRGEQVASGVSSAVFPHELFAPSEDRIGLTNIPRDLDSVVRRAWLTLSHQDEPYYTLPVALAAAQMKRTPADVAAEALRLGYADHPFLGGNSILVNFCGPAGTFKRVPYYQVIAGLTPPETFRGKIVLVGGSAEILQDIYPTPMARAEPGQGRLARLAPMPGVEVQANMLATLLSREYLRPVSPRAINAAIFLVALLIVFATLVWRPLRGALVTVVLLAGSAAFATWLLWQHRLWLPITPLLLVGALSYVEGTAYMFFAEERARLRMRRAWQQRVSAEVLHVILNNPVEKVAGRRIVATVMFSDLRGFTTMCYNFPPEQVVESLNEYLTAMTEVIREHGGTIHKFIGDGIMAVFGDPVPHADHADRAVHAAIAMQRRLMALNRANTAEGKGKLLMGVGLHTGFLVAGDIGSQQLLEYTVIGDTVSTSSRIEGLNKEHKTGILLSGQTREALTDTSLPLKQVTTQAVRGRDELLELFTVDDSEINGQFIDDRSQAGNLASPANT
ncbi:MAG: adenylate/guanylate cyclase domain-containing protein [Armatimonadia bacterium]